MKSFLKKAFNIFFNKLIYRYCKFKLDKYLKNVCKPKIKLTTTEKKMLDEVWKKLKLKYNYDWFSFYKSFENGFSPYYIPQDIWSGIEFILNPLQYRNMLSHKGFLHKFVSSEYLPHTLINIIEGVIYDENDQIISKECARDILWNNREFVKKYSTNFGGGNGVCFYDLSKNNDEEKNKIISEILETSEDLICQQTLKISDELSRYNPYSVNTIRVFTINLNGSVSVVSSYMRMSSSQRKNDNVCTGGVYIGVKSDGKLHEYGLNKGFQRFYKAPSMISFKGEKITSYEKIKNVVTEQHGKIPFVKFVAWDVTIDINNNIRIIELNLDSQNLEYHQPFNGPFLKDRTEEVINYVMRIDSKRFWYV